MLEKVVKMKEWVTHTFRLSLFSSKSPQKRFGWILIWRNVYRKLQFSQWVIGIVRIELESLSGFIRLQTLISSYLILVDLMASCISMVQDTDIENIGRIMLSEPFIFYFSMKHFLSTLLSSVIFLKEYFLLGHKYVYVIKNLTSSPLAF